VQRALSHGVWTFTVCPRQTPRFLRDRDACRAEGSCQRARTSINLPRARCTNVVHDLGSAEPRSKVEPSSRWIALHQVELGSADPVQLNRRGYSVDDADWSSHAGQWAKHSDVTVAHNAYETVNYRLAIICSDFKFPRSSYTTFTPTTAYQSPQNTYSVFR